MSNTILLKNKKSSIDMFDIFILIAFSYNSLLVYFSAVFARLPVISVIGYQIIPFVVSLFAIVCFIGGYFKKTTGFDCIIILFFILAILMSYILHPETQDAYTKNNLRSVYVEAIPFFLLGINFRSNEKTMKNLTFLSYIAIVINMLYMFLYVGLTSQEGEYYMGQSYMILAHVMFAINSVFDRNIIKNRVLPVLFSILGLFFLLAMGTRGPLLIAIVYLCIKIFMSIDKKKPKTIVVFSIVVFAVFLFFVSGLYLTILQSVSETLSKYGMSTRVIDLFLENEYIANTSGRDDIYELLLQKISEKPLFGYGVFGEEQFGVYSHNIALEMIMYYGIPLGITLIITYLTIAIKAYTKSKSKYAKEFILLFLVQIIVHSMFGGSHISYYFFFLLGISMAELRKAKIIKKTDC